MFRWISGLDVFHKPVPEPLRVRHVTLARRYAAFSDGVTMLVADSANQAIRHCRIGLVTFKK